MAENQGQKCRIGLWLDHGRAVVVTLTGKTARIQKLVSGVERHTRLAGGARGATAYAAQDVASESCHQRRFENQLAAYYQRLISQLKGADKLFVFGPGGAKMELKKALEKQKSFRGKIVAVEPADKMTERQIVAKVLRYFSSGR
jgi:hypothetical protein